jgi:hypothetical protein
MTLPFAALLALIFLPQAPPVHDARGVLVPSLHLPAAALLRRLIAAKLSALLGWGGLEAPVVDNVLSAVNLAACALYVYAAIGPVYDARGHAARVEGAGSDAGRGRDRARLPVRRISDHAVRDLITRSRHSPLDFDRGRARSVLRVDLLDLMFATDVAVPIRAYRVRHPGHSGSRSGIDQFGGDDLFCHARCDRQSRDCDREMRLHHSFPPELHCRPGWERSGWTAA